MKKFVFAYMLLVLPMCSSAQLDPHYTMFMYNKLVYNPAYAGSRDVTSVNATYRNQWVGIQGAPRTLNVAMDGPAGNYMKSFRPVAVGLLVNSEQLGVEHNTAIIANYAYRIRFGKGVLSMGLRGGARLYTANYSQLDLGQQQDMQFTHDLRNVFLPNFGAGIYWSTDKYYVSVSVPNMLQNYFDKEGKKINNRTYREIRGYYLSGGYVLQISENIKLQPQVMGRYIGNGSYQLPFNSDINLSAIAFDRFLFGITYRTDKSIEGIVHIQATRNINIGYAYDYSVSALNGYNKGTHELVIGYDFHRDNTKFPTPRFIKAF